MALLAPKPGQKAESEQKQVEEEVKDNTQRYRIYKDFNREEVIEKVVETLQTQALEEAQKELQDEFDLNDLEDSDGNS